VKFIRWVAPTIATAAATAGAVFTGVPFDVAALLGSGVGQATDRLLPVERSRSSVVRDETNKIRRSVTYEEFGASVARVWHAAGLLVTFRPKLVGYVHGLLLLMRAQKSFEVEMAKSVGALSNILLYASSDTQEKALDVYKTLGAKLTELGASARDPVEASDVYGRASGEIGDKVVLWRKAAQDDLALADEVS